MKRYIFILILIMPELSCLGQHTDIDSLIMAIFDSTKVIYADTSREFSHDSAKTWDLGGMISVNVAQAAFSNWSKGGDNSVAGNGMFNLYTVYQKEKTFWINSLDLNLGWIWTEGEKATKNEDRVELLSKYGRMTGQENWFLSGLLNGKTQLLPGKYSGADTSFKFSSFMNPAYVFLSAGAEYKPEKNISLLISPATGRMTVIIDEEIAGLGDFIDIGRSINEYVQLDLGGLIKLNMKGELFKNFLYRNKLDLFTAYTRKPYRFVVDVDWELRLTYKFSKYFAANLQTHLVYNEDVDLPGTDSKVQFREILGAGFTYSFE